MAERALRACSWPGGPARQARWGPATGQGSRASIHQVLIVRCSPAGRELQSADGMGSDSLGIALTRQASDKCCEGEGKFSRVRFQADSVRACLQYHEHHASITWIRDGHMCPYMYPGMEGVEGAGNDSWR